MMIRDLLLEPEARNSKNYTVVVYNSVWSLKSWFAFSLLLFSAPLSSFSWYFRKYHLKSPPIRLHAPCPQVKVTFQSIVKFTIAKSALCLPLASTSNGKSFLCTLNGDLSTFIYGIVYINIWEWGKYPADSHLYVWSYTELA